MSMPIRDIADNKRSKNRIRNLCTNEHNPIYCSTRFFNSTSFQDFSTRVSYVVLNSLGIESGHIKYLKDACSSSTKNIINVSKALGLRK